MDKVTFTSALAVSLGAPVADFDKKSYHSSQRGLSGAIGVRHVTDSAPPLFSCINDYKSEGEVEPTQSNRVMKRFAPLLCWFHSWL